MKSIKKNEKDLSNYTDKEENVYYPILEALFEMKREESEEVLEIGIGKGVSIYLWNEYFKKAIIYGIDMDDKIMIPEIKNREKIKLYFGRAYNMNTVKKWFKGKTFDIIIHEGNNNLLSLKQVLKIYMPLLSEKGILLIEDLKHWEWVYILKELVGKEMEEYIEVYDMRFIRGTKEDSDKILFVINKTKSTYDTIYKMKFTEYDNLVKGI